MKVQNIDLLLLAMGLLIIYFREEKNYYGRPAVRILKRIKILESGFILIFNILELVAVVST